MGTWSDLFIQYLLPIAGAVVAGSLIGLEREFRGRPAGLRTHILVCLASALLMLAAVHQVRWLTDTPHGLIRIDPVRMAHGILTGIGFLCGGVIFRHGFSVHGLTTAASLWITSALGILYGVGFYGLAVGGSLATVLVLAAFRAFDRIVPQMAIVETKVRYRRGEAGPEPEFRDLISDLGFRTRAVTHRLTDGGEVVELSATLHGRRGAEIQAFSDRLCADPRVVEFEIAPRDD